MASIHKNAGGFAPENVQKVAKKVRIRNNDKKKRMILIKFGNI